MSPMLPAQGRRLAGVQGDSDAIRSSRSFALLLRGSVQVFRVNFKAQPLSRPPATAAECCAQLAQLALPPAFTPGQLTAPGATGGTAWSWSFDDAGVPAFEEQRRQLEAAQALPPLNLGRWFWGLLRFLATVLQPVWRLPLVSSSKGRQFTDLFRLQGDDSLCLTVAEESLKLLLSRLRPALRFARRQGLASPPGGAAATSAPKGVAARARLYAADTTAAHEGLAQVQSLLSKVLDVADRAQQVLGLLGVLYTRQNMSRVLQSREVAGSFLEALVQKPLGALVADAEAVEPLVQLCTALIVDSGLAAPEANVAFNHQAAASISEHQRGAGVIGVDRCSISGEVCRELEQQCPGIFARVDLDHVQRRLGLVSRGAAATSERLRSYASCVSPASVGDHWVKLVRSIQAMAAENPRSAVDLCVEKLDQLQKVRFADAPSEQEVALAADRAKMLLEALLGAIGATPRAGEPATSMRGIVEHVLTKTSFLRFAGKDSAEPDSSKLKPLPFAHRVILDYLLACPHQKNVLEALLETSQADVEGFLKDRLSANLAAGELLWKHHMRQGRPAAASELLLQLAERPDNDCGLLARVHLLDLARQAARQGSGRGMAQSKEFVQQLSAKSDIAVRVQVPLHHELQLIATDERVSARWRGVAVQKREALQQLQGLQDLYQVAEDFSLYHIILVIADVSSSVQEREVGSSAWISVFFPPVASPYSPSELGSELEKWQQGVFPLLMVRRCTTFLSRDTPASPSSVSSAVSYEELQSRSTRLLEELGTAMQDGSAMWDVRCITTLLEYCNCLWVHALQGEEGLANDKRAIPGAGVDLDDQVDQQPNRAWVALRVLLQPPFRFTLANVVNFYAAMLDHIREWVGEIQRALPADPTRDPRRRRPVLNEDDLYVHLSEVLTTVLDRWTAQVDASRADQRAPDEFAGGWPAAEGVLAKIRLRLGDVEDDMHFASVQRLQKEVRRLEERGRRISARGGQEGLKQPTAPPPLPMMPPPVPAIPELA